MCCNYCLRFTSCKKTKKTKPKCCPECDEYEFCPLVADGGKNPGLESAVTEEDSETEEAEVETDTGTSAEADTDNDLDIPEDEEI
jgi:hypothetical protein